MATCSSNCCARDELDLERSQQTMAFQRCCCPCRATRRSFSPSSTACSTGDARAVGDFYALCWRDSDGREHRICDPLAASVPFGTFAPAEILDTQGLHRDRTDRAYYEQLAAAAGDAIHKFSTPTNILQVHVPTATAGGTLASLARHFERIAERLRHDLPLEDGDELYMGYDAVQLLPVEPTTVYETGPSFWQEFSRDESHCHVDLLRPNTTNWGYDVVIAGMAALNPVLLETGRPHELCDLAAVLHNWPGKAKMLILDVVFGHADNQALDVLSPHYLAGPNMYGQNLDYRNPPCARSCWKCSAARSTSAPMACASTAPRISSGGTTARRNCATTTNTCRAWPTSSRRSAACATAPGSSSRTAAPGPRRTGSWPPPTAR
jgi:hypothetical protein